MKARSAILVAAGLLLVAALALQFLRLRNIKNGDTATAARPLGLAKILPANAAGWVVRDEPLGATEFVRSEVEKTLNYDDVVNRTYRKGDRSFGLYVAFWAAGRMPVQKVASHTPDRCWSENGWKCEQMRAGDRLPLGNGELKPAYWRLFSAPGANGLRQYVLYWHLVDGELYDYGDGFNRRPDPLKWWRETLHYAIKGSADQYFIRLTSDRPFEEIQSDPGFQQVLAGLAQLGLRADDRPVVVDGR
jgi:hypothetical protein